MKPLASLVCLVAVSVAFGQSDKAKAVIEDGKKRKEATAKILDEKMQAQEEKVKEVQAEINLANKGMLNASQATGIRVNAKGERIYYFKTANDKAAVLKKLSAEQGKRAKELSKWQEAKKELDGKPYLLRSLEPAKWKQGEIGELNYYISVFQVIDGNNFIGKVGEELFWVSNYPTGGLVDGKRYDIGGAFEVIGTKSYTSVLGANKTIYHIARFRLD